MSAEKEIVNYWYNKRGFFTINNIKTKSNRDCGILAFKPQDSRDEILHVEISCSITSNMPETKELSKSVARVVGEKFEDSGISETIRNYTEQFGAGSSIKRILVLGAVPKSRKTQISGEFGKRNVEVMDFEAVLYDVLENLDTQYYKNDIIRTLQLTKFLLLSEPAKMAKLLSNESFTQASRKEFLSKILDKQEIIKEFRKTNSERLGAILKSAGLKPNELAEMLERSILNNKTRKIFLDSFMGQEKTRKMLNKSKRVKKANMPLGRFF